MLPVPTSSPRALPTALAGLFPLALTQWNPGGPSTSVVESPLRDSTPAGHNRILGGKKKEKNLSIHNGIYFYTSNNFPSICLARNRYSNCC